MAFFHHADFWVICDMLNVETRSLLPVVGERCLWGKNPFVKWHNATRIAKRQIFFFEERTILICRYSKISGSKLSTGKLMSCWGLQKISPASIPWAIYSISCRRGTHALYLRSDALQSSGRYTRSGLEQKKRCSSNKNRNGEYDGELWQRQINSSVIDVAVLRILEGRRGVF